MLREVTLAEGSLMVVTVDWHSWIWLEVAASDSSVDLIRHSCCYQSLSCMKNDSDRDLGGETRQVSLVLA